MKSIQNIIIKILKNDYRALSIDQLLDELSDCFENDGAEAEGLF